MTLGTLLLIYFLIVTYFVMVSIASQVYVAKGRSQTIGALWGLIPVYGLIRAYTIEPARKTTAYAIKKTYKLTAILMDYLITGQIVLVAIIVLVPVVYMLGSSLAITSSLPTTLWPQKISFDNYVNLFTGTKFLVWIKNTFLVAILSMVIGVVFITGASYVFARFKFKGKKLGLITILVLQVFPSFMGMIAMFTLFEVFGLLGKPLALTILYVGGAVPFNLWLIKGYLQQVPKDLDESAMLDGANKLQIFFKIILPLSVPILSFVAVSMFMSPWMDYMLPKFLLDVNVKGDSEAVKNQWTLAVGLFEMISGADKSDYTTFAAGSIIIALPITVLYVCFQKFLIQGITAGATKG